MAQTALQELIEYIEKDYEWFLKHSPDYGVVPKILEKAQSLLPKERQIIENAHATGVVDGDFSTGFTGSDYFTQNFNPIN